MIFINPIEILELQNHSVQEINNQLIKRQKRKLFADIDLSDDGFYDYKGISLTKVDCESAIEKLEKSDYVLLYKHLASDNQLLNDFLVNGDEGFFSNYTQESIYKLPEFVNFISPYFALKFDKVLAQSFKSKDFEKTQRILRTQNLINDSDQNTAFKCTSIEISENIKKVQDITDKIKNKETKWTAETVSGLLFHIRNWVPVNILNLLPKYFQSQINKTASALNKLQLVIWEELHNPSVCRQLLDYLLSLNIESVGKKTFEDNYKIVKQADEKKHIDKLISIINSFDNKAKTILNAKELIFQTKQYLFNLKSVSQLNDNTYISLSTRVAFTAQSYIIEEVNNSKSADSRYNSILGLPTLKSILKDAWEATQLIGSLDMQNEFIANSYNPNKETLYDLCVNFNVSTPQITTGKITKSNFVIIEGVIKHIDKESKLLPITNPFIKDSVRFIRLDLRVEVFANQTVKFDLKYIQPNGTVKMGTSSPSGFTMSNEKIINVNTKIIDLLGWGNNEKGTYEVGTHYIEVWIENCLIYRKSFVVDLSAEEKAENTRREVEKREREKRETEKRKEEARIEDEKRKAQAIIDAEKSKEKKIRSWCIWIMGIFTGLAVIFSIWGLAGLKVLGIIIVVLIVLLLWILGSKK